MWWISETVVDLPLVPVIADHLVRRQRRRGLCANNSMSPMIGIPAARAFAAIGWRLIGHAGRDDERVELEQDRGRLGLAPQLHPGEGRGSVSGSSQLGPGLRRGGSSGEPRAYPHRCPTPPRPRRSPPARAHSPHPSARARAPHSASPPNPARRSYRRAPAKAGAQSHKRHRPDLWIPACAGMR